MEQRKKTDINKLIQIARDNRDKIFSTKNIDENLTDAVKFCLSFNIKEGGNKIFTSLIYQAYTLYNPKPISKTDFIADFSSMFELKSSSTKSYFMLNYKPAQLLNVASKRRIVLNE